MNKEIGKLEWDCQLITKDGKYFGYGSNEARGQAVKGDALMLLLTSMAEYINKI